MAVPRSDILSSILAGLRLDSSVAGAFDAAGNFAVDLEDFEGLKLHLALRGDFWLKAKGHDSLRVSEGDCVVMTDGQAVTFSKTRRVTRVIKRSNLSRSAVNGVMTMNGGGEYFGVGLHFLFRGEFAKVLFKTLPPIIVVKRPSDQSSALSWAVERFRFEFANQAPGRGVALDSLAPLILLQILRDYGLPQSSHQNWVAALSDPKLSRVIGAIHDHPEVAWTLELLAREALMSRSGFAAIFKECVGMTPLHYVKGWRIQVASEMLLSSRKNVGEIADAVGYQSESSFSKAFTEIVGCRPGKYRQQHAQSS